MGFADHFSNVASGYARYRPTYPDALFDWLAAETASGAAAWDVATGNGQAAVGLAGRLERVVATDGSHAQLVRATSHPRVRYAVATAERAPLADRSVGLVTVAQALHWFDHPRFFAEVRRVLAPGGWFVAWCYDAFRTEDAAVDRLVRRFYRETVGPYWPPERRLLEEGYRSIEIPLTEGSAPPFAMELAWSFPDLLGYLGTWSATARYLAANGGDPVGELARELEPAWGTAERRRFEWPLSFRVGRLG